MLSLSRRAAVPLLARRPEGAALAASSAQPALHPILRLQQTLGNRAVQRMLNPEGEQEAPQAKEAPQAQPAPEAPTAETTEAAAEAPPATKPAPPPLGHAPAPKGIAACPDAPLPKHLTVTCPATSSGPLVLPTPSTAPFGGDPDRARFARELARCKAARKLKEEIEKRYQEDKTLARQRATEEAKSEKEVAIDAAVKDLDPKDTRAVNRAKAKAAADAEKAAKVKIAAAVADVTRQVPFLVEDELAAAYEQEYEADYAATLQAAIVRYGKDWKNLAQYWLDKARQKITLQKNAKPKVPKGQTPPEPKTAEQIAAEIEAEMLPERCKQEEWLLNRLEAVGFAWAVGRREQLDFETIPQNVTYLKNFAPAFQVAKADWVEIPVHLQVKSKEKMPGIAQELADFLKQLALDPGAPPFLVGNYGGHGIGDWEDKGFSVDLYLQRTALDRRGFYDPAKAEAFLLAIDRTAKALGARWRVVYDDFVVAQKVNSITGKHSVGFHGGIYKGLLNWHGPDPLILHFHLDLEIKQAVKQPVPAGAACHAPDPNDPGVCHAPEP